MTSFVKNNSISIHRIFKSCADSTTKIFLPILIYQKTQNLHLVFAFFLAYFFLWGSLNLVLKPLFQKHVLTLVSVSFIPWILLLAYITFVPLTLFGVLLLGVFGALGGALYSVPMNIIFTINKKTNNIAKYDAASIIGKIIFVFLTAYLIGNSFKDSFVLVMIIGSALYIISTLFVFANKQEILNLLNQSSSTKISDSIKLNSNFNTLHMFFGTFQSIIDTILPLFLFYNNFDLQQVSYIIIISELIKIASSFTAKYLNSKKKDNLMILISGIFFILSVSILPLFPNITFYYAISIALPLAFPFVHVSIFSRYVKQLKANDDFIAGHAIRDFFIITPRTLVYSAFFITGTFTPVLILGILTGFGMIAKNSSLTKINLFENKQPQHLTTENFQVQNNLDDDVFVEQL